MLAKLFFLLTLESWLIHLWFIIFVLIPSDRQYSDMFENGNNVRRKRMRGRPYKSPSLGHFKSLWTPAAAAAAAAAAANRGHPHHSAALYRSSHHYYNPFMYPGVAAAAAAAAAAHVAGTNHPTQNIPSSDSVHSDAGIR